MIDIYNIIKLLPHRYPFLLVDRIITILPNEIVGMKNVTCNEPYFVGHFPDMPVMPGVLIVEAMAQLSAVFVGHTLNINAENKIVYLISIENARFKKIVKPGDQMIMEAKVVQCKMNVWKFDTKAIVDKQIVSESTITAIIKDK